jgi:centrosomal protein CEP76
LEPSFDESFLLELQPPDCPRLLDLKTLVQLDAPIHLALIQVTPRDGRAQNQLISTHALEWRRCLGRGGLSVPLQFMAAGAEAKMQVPVGVVEFRLDLLPAPLHGQAMQSAEISKALQASADSIADSHRQFYHYARIWWQQFSEISPDHKNRLVKIFAENEIGEHRPVCSYITPLRAGRLLATPRHAARFVSLIPYVTSQAVGGGRIRTWHSLHTFLALGQGDCEDHAVLLVSLLLGFGLDAYICVGDKGRDTDHIWVMTRTGDPPHQITFWESLTGQRSPQRPQNGKSWHPYQSVGCVFNHLRFWGNIQHDCSAKTCSFELENPAIWKSMDSQLIAPLPHQHVVPLIPPALNCMPVEEQLESQLRMQVDSIRLQSKLSTTWDSDLSFLLMPALVAYETEKITGSPFGNEDFQCAIKGVVPKGYCFKGYPTMFAHQEPERMLSVLQKHDTALDILNTTGDHISFALRVKITAYPEGMVACWIMLAVRYLPYATRPY